MLKQKIREKITYVITVLTLGIASGSFSRADDYVWYDQLLKSALTPPQWIFAPTWIILYIILGIIFYIIFNLKNNKFLVYILSLHFISNLAWSYIFFKQHNIQLAFYNLLFMWVSLVMIIILASKIKSLIILILPYFSWISYALYLNFKIYQLN